MPKEDTGFMLCDDLMEKVGKEVVKKREQETLDYWIDLDFRGGNRMNLCGVSSQIKWFAMDGHDSLFEALAQDIQISADEYDWDPDEDDRWWWVEEDEFWQQYTPNVTRAFTKGTYWQKYTNQ